MHFKIKKILYKYISAMLLIEFFGIDFRVDVLKKESHFRNIHGITKDSQTIYSEALKTGIMLM